jgi:hypothetical protein
LKVTTPLDSLEGNRYIDIAIRNDIDNLYKMTARMEDYVNPTVDGVLSWRVINLCASYSKEGLKHWQ